MNNNDHLRLRAIGTPLLKFLDPPLYRYQTPPRHQHIICFDCVMYFSDLKGLQIDKFLGIVWSEDV